MMTDAGGQTTTKMNTQSLDGFASIIKVPRMNFVVPVGRKGGDIQVSILSPTDSTASTPRSESSVASSDVAGAFYSLDYHRGDSKESNWSMHPIVVARDSFLSYFSNNVQSLLVPRQRYLASIEKTSHQDEGQRFIQDQMKLKISRVNTALQSNALIANDICREAQCLLPFDIVLPTTATSPADEGIARSTIRQLWRDWSAEAQSERNICFEPILSAMKCLVGDIRPDQLEYFRVLVPGAGLCRLACEIAKIADFPVIANELSYHQILATHWVLNQSSSRSFRVSPWATQFSNHIKSSDQFRSYAIPEAGSTPLRPGAKATLEPSHGVDSSGYVTLRCGNLTVTPDDFRDYTAQAHAGTFSCVVTAFFLDTAPNVLDYVTTIKNVLIAGGTWINVGPLLWNCFENGPGGRREGDSDDDEAAQLRQASEQRHGGVAAEIKTFDGKVELAWDEVMNLIEFMGFEIQENVDSLGEAGYILDRKSMLLPLYQVGYFRVTKMDE